MTHEADLDRSDSPAGIAVALNEAAQRAVAYLAGVTDRPVAPTAEALSGLRQLDVPFPESPLSPEEVVACLDIIGSPGTTAMAGGRYYGFVNGGALPASVAASWLAAAWDQNVALRVMSPAGATWN